MMKAMKVSVGCCSVESQNVIIQKAYSILSSHTKFQLNDVGRLTLTSGKYDISPKDEGVLLLFASVIIALRPKTHIPNIRGLLHLLIITLLKGVVPVAQALGSMLNKLTSKSNGAEKSDELTLEEALDIIFNKLISKFNISDADDFLNRNFHATVQLLYKQRIFSSMTPIFLQLI
jgi:DNA repair/transcription protein MET18/MMS19